MKFLLIEDNAKLARAICDRLTLDGHAVDRAGNLEDGLAHAETSEYDIVLLDIMLPDGDGRGFLKRMRDTLATPIIAVTARSDVSDRVSILDMGADDYVVKPFDFAELEARCRAVYRRRGGQASNRLEVGDAVLDPLLGTLTAGRVETQLRNRELRLAEALFGAPGQIFSKSRLVDRLFALDEEVSENAIEVYIARLRKHLAGSTAVIETCRSLGYRLIAR